MNKILRIFIKNSENFWDNFLLLCVPKESSPFSLASGHTFRLQRVRKKMPIESSHFSLAGSPKKCQKKVCAFHLQGVALFACRGHIFHLQRVTLFTCSWVRKNAKESSHFSLAGITLFTCRESEKNAKTTDRVPTCYLRMLFYWDFIFWGGSGRFFWVGRGVGLKCFWKELSFPNSPRYVYDDWFLILRYLQLFCFCCRMAA